MQTQSTNHPNADVKEGDKRVDSWQTADESAPSSGGLSPAAASRRESFRAADLPSRTSADDEKKSSSSAADPPQSPSSRRHNKKREQRAVAAVLKAVPDFKNEAKDSFAVKSLTGGLTNQLYVVRHLPSDRAVVVRIYGKDSGSFISRESEEFWQSFFLKTYGRVGKNMLIYEFLGDYRTLESEELREWSTAIARKVAEVHTEATSCTIFHPHPQTGQTGIGAAGMRALASRSDFGLGQNASKKRDNDEEVAVAKTYDYLHHTAGSPGMAAAGKKGSPQASGAKKAEADEEVAVAKTYDYLHHTAGSPAMAAGKKGNPSHLQLPHVHSFISDSTASPRSPPPGQQVGGAAAKAAYWDYYGNGAPNHTIAALTEWVDQLQDLKQIRQALARGGSPATTQQDDHGKDANPSSSSEERIRLFDEGLGWHLPPSGAEDAPTSNHASQTPSSYDIPSRLLHERDWLLSVIHHNACMLPTAVCHNDLLAGNIMVRESEEEGGKAEDKKLSEGGGAKETRTSAHNKDRHPAGTYDMRFIDFEYTRRNYVYFEIANHFNEYAGIDLNYEAFPTREEGEAFVRTYVSHGRRLVAAMRRAKESIIDAQGGQGGTKERDKGEGADPSRVTDEEVRSATDLVFFFTLVSNFIWAVWSVLQAVRSDIDFDYLEYGVSRWKRYLETKEAFGKPVSEGMHDGGASGTQQQSSPEPMEDKIQPSETKVSALC